MCAAAAASWLDCGGTEDGGDPEVTSEAIVCTTVQAGSPWWNSAFPRQSGRFHVELTATPSAGNLDAVIGLSQGGASQWARLAAIVRFNAEGFIDVRSGNEYRADSAYTYRAGATYFIRFDVDLSTHSYSVWLKQYDLESYTRIARDYPFRTEQARVVALDNAASFLEPFRPGSLAICDLSVVQDDTTGDGCVRAASGGGFANAPIAGTTGAMIAHFTATPSVAGIDAVFGFGRGVIDDYNDYAASIRFWTNGLIEARDGDVYRADVPVRYVPGAAQELWMIVDLPTGTYSVLVSAAGSPWDLYEIARGYRFRTQQQVVTALDHGAAVVDSATGRVEVCSIANTTPRSLSFAREGNYGTLPLPGGGALISGDARIQRLDAAGRTIAEIPLSGGMAVDTRGNLYVASGPGGPLTLSSFTSALAPRWTRTYAVEGELRAMGAYSTGEIAVVVGSQLVEIDPSGSERRRIDLALPPLSSTKVAIAPCSFAIAYERDGSVVVEAHEPSGALRWRRSWSGGLTLDVMASDPSGGVVFAGTFRQTVDFGNGPFEPIEPPDGPGPNTYLVVLAGDGSLRFSKRLYTMFPRGVATDGNRIAITSELFAQMPYMEVRAFNAGGAQILDWNHNYDTAGLGRTGAVAVGDDGRIYANVELAFAPGAQPLFSWPFLLAFDP